MAQHMRSDFATERFHRGLLQDVAINKIGYIITLGIAEKKLCPVSTKKSLLFYEKHDVTANLLKLWLYVYISYRRKRLGGVYALKCGENSLCNVDNMP